MNIMHYITFNLSRMCYFTVESTNKKSEFMKCLNCSYKLACLQCSLTDKELGEFIQFKKQKTKDLQKKYAVKQIGLQPDGTWVMANNIYLSSEGRILNMKESQYVWISDLFSGPSIPSACEQC